MAESWKYIYETAYSHIEISERYESPSREKKIRDLRIDNVTHAGMYLDNDDLVYLYTRYYHLFDVLLPEAQNMLMLWGSAYSFPKSFLETYPEKYIDVVEIDEKATLIAQKHFRLKNDPHLEIYHQDARVYLNTTNKRYDAILGDAFGSYLSIPYQLTTLEVAQKKYDILRDDGIVILNVISSLEWEKAQFLEAEYKTYKQVFPEVFIIPVSDPFDTQRTQNIMFIASKNPEKLNFLTSNIEYTNYLSKRTYLAPSEEVSILTDDFAPVDYYISKLQ